jgi:plastocyanin
MLSPRVLTCAALAVLLVGCGEEDPVRVRDRVVEVELTDYRIKPQLIRSDAGRTIFRIRNVGRLPHNFHIRGETQTRLKVSTLLPGESFIRTGIRMRRGDWVMFCSIANHEELGMHGTLIVR